MEASLLPNIFSFLSQISPFDRLSDEETNRLAARIDILYLIKGKALAEEELVGKGLYIVRSGAVEQNNTDQTLRARLSDGDLFGFSQLYQKKHSAYSVRAIENTLLYRIPVDVLSELIESSPALQGHFSAQESVRLAKSTSVITTDESIYLRSVDSIMNTEVAEVAGNTPICEAARTMVNNHRSSALVMDGENLLGIVTDRDMTKRVVAEQIDTNRPVSDIMTRQPQTIPAGASMLEAIELMMQHNVRSLPVIHHNKIMGVVTATSLVERSQAQAVFLISRIYRKESLSELCSLTAQRSNVFKTLIETRTHPRTVQHMMTLIADAYNKRLLQLAEKELGPPPIRYVWFVAGSQARYEIHNLSDQDNGIILQRPPSAQERAYFQQLADFVCQGLDQCGYTLCSGNMMASNPQWLTDLESWQHQFGQWIKYPETEALLNACVFFDIRPLFGDPTLTTALKQKISSFLHGNSRFLSIMLANSLRTSPPLGVFRQFVFEKNGTNRKEFNIKKHAVNLLVELVRIYALAAKSKETTLEKRIKAAIHARLLSEEGGREIMEAFDFINQVRFTHQYNASEHLEAMSNNIAPELLTQFEKNHLKDAFRIISRYQEFAESQFKSFGILS
ncbi:Hypoxic response protein 1 [Vibrio aerogenes CECT 7868]|uniref:Hypoxic response protein 1 n=2 Tax=Vibrio aerogenes TaxID=92172 RepID=A0A1M5VDK0_9VIBR|nr:Hypoxic response protein 1 [Vibrio aerogenes CECT 7868]